MKWEHRLIGSTLWVVLNGQPNKAVRCKADGKGRFMWQFRKTISYANSIDEAITFVEAGEEFFTIMHRNPYN